MLDEARTTITLEKTTELVSKITIDCLNHKGESVLSAEAELRRDTSPWTITTRPVISEDFSALDATEVYQSLWILSETLEGLIVTCFETENESEDYLEEK